MSKRHQLRVAVVGAGIGGLTTAIALRNSGIEATVYEQARELKALGAGVSIAPNGSRILRELGLGDALDTVAGRVSGYAFRTWRGESMAGDLSLGDPAETWYLHRGEFQEVLSDALPSDAVQLGWRCVGATESDDGVAVEFADGAVVEADLLVAADGIHSRLEGVVARPAEPVSEGIMAYRGLLPAERVRDVTDMDRISMWLGPRQSFLLYPVSAGQLLNLVAFVPTDLDVEESWTAPGSVTDLAAAFEDWDDQVRSVIAAMDETFRWGIYDREPLDTWSTARVTLLGDSAHAVTPHLGQGANQAVEDAITLAVVLQDATTDDLPDRLRTYESLRHDRTRTVRREAREAGAIYRAEDADPRQQAERLRQIFDGIEINTYDARERARRAVAG